jgi:hypothetical protein
MYKCTKCYNLINIIEDENTIVIINGNKQYLKKQYSEKEYLITPLLCKICQDEIKQYEPLYEHLTEYIGETPPPTESLLELRNIAFNAMKSCNTKINYGELTDKYMKEYENKYGNPSYDDYIKKILFYKNISDKFSK